MSVTSQVPVCRAAVFGFGSADRVRSLSGSCSYNSLTAEGRKLLDGATSGREAEPRRVHKQKVDHSKTFSGNGKSKTV